MGWHSSRLNHLLRKNASRSIGCCYLFENNLYPFIWLRLSVQKKASVWMPKNHSLAACHLFVIHSWSMGRRLNRLDHPFRKKCLNSCCYPFENNLYSFEWLTLSVQKKITICSNGWGYPLEKKLIIHSNGWGYPSEKIMIRLNGCRSSVWIKSSSINSNS